MLNGKPGTLAVRAAAEALADLAKENPAGQVCVAPMQCFFPSGREETWRCVRYVAAHILLSLKKL
jgi:hypothetical protein